VIDRRKEGEERGAGKWRPHAHLENSKNFPNRSRRKIETKKYLMAASILEIWPRPKIQK